MQSNPADDPSFPNAPKAIKSQEIIFILGILQRSGTNYLLDLLDLHPDCQSVPTIGEDHLLANASHLDGFVEGVVKRWNSNWDPDGEWKQVLREHLGQACVSFLVSLAQRVFPTLPRYLVTKTPSVENLHLLSLFPQVKTIVIVRDGRDLVESGMRSFGWSFEAACRQWVEGARQIMKAQEAGLPFLLVRYEDLQNDLKTQMARICVLLTLELSCFDFEAARDLPVRGSCDFGRGKGQVHWSPVAKTAGFKPMHRWAKWSRARQERFSWIAGPTMAYFGYELDSGKSWRFWWTCWNRVVDLKGPFVSFVVRFVKRVGTWTSRMFRST